MHARRVGAALGLSLMAMIGMTSPALGGTVLYSAQGWVVQAASASYDFTIRTPGSVAITLDDYVLPTALQSLDVSLFKVSATGAVTPIGSMAGSGEKLFNLTSGMYSAQLAAVGGGAAEIGLFGWSLNFSPQTSTVPLPRSAGLLVAGAGLLLGVLIPRRRSMASALS